MSKNNIITYFYIIFLSVINLHNYAVSKETQYGEAFHAIKQEYLGTSDYINNSKIKIIIQEEIEEAHEVAMVVKIPKELNLNKQIVILVDDNPIQLVTRIYPQREVKSIGMNIRLEQDSYVRAAILSDDNIWNIGSKKVIVNSPGGCSLPSCNPEKEICEIKELGKISMQKYKRTSGDWRLKFKINHPMDTGLVSDPKSGKTIPEYYINKVDFSDKNGYLAKAKTYGALSANPTLVLDFGNPIKNINVKATDTKGLEFQLPSNYDF